MAKCLQPTQVEAHVSRLTAIKTQLVSYKDADGRAADAIPAIDAVIGILSGECFEPTSEILPEESPETVGDDTDESE